MFLNSTDPYVYLSGGYCLCIWCSHCFFKGYLELPESAVHLGKATETGSWAFILNLTQDFFMDHSTRKNSP